MAGLYESADAAIPVVTATELDEILFGNAKACEQLARLMSSQRRALKGGWLAGRAAGSGRQSPDSADPTAAHTA